MSNTAIKVESLGKRYRIGAAPKALHGIARLKSVLGTPFRYLGQQLRGPTDEEVLWALRNVSFTVERGEVLGIIGANGAGKSTLLKILARITEPTEGRAEIRGRLGSLLEVGTGFHPELTGRENVYLSGAILGMKRTEITSKFDQIVAFAGVDKFIDTPVKRYSSGMYVRLAFAVAAHLEPEILLVDEVLAVGDAAFQKKCLGRMGEVAQEGRTVLFVSHNMLAMQQLCSRALWVSGGNVVAMGSPSDIVARYLGENAEKLTDRTWNDPKEAPGNDDLYLRAARVRPHDTESNSSISVKMPLTLEFEFVNRRDNATLDLSVLLQDKSGVTAFNTATNLEKTWHGRPMPAGVYRSTCHIPGNLLNTGPYRVTLLVVRDQTTPICRLSDILTFDVVEAPELRGAWHKRLPGVVRPLLDWQTEKLESRGE